MREADLVHHRRAQHRQRRPVAARHRGLYGLHECIARLTAGVVDARFFAILDTAAESPPGQVAVVSLLAWIARNAPAHRKATFFAVMASFTNLALSAMQLGTRHLNEIFVITREVTDPETGEVTTPQAVPDRRVTGGGRTGGWTRARAGVTCR